VARWILRRFLWAIPTLLGITAVVFLAVHLAPGDPQSVIEEAAFAAPGDVDVAARLERFRAEHLLDRPLAVQYLHFLGPFDLSPRGHAWFGGRGEHPWHGLLALDLGEEWARPGVRIAPEIARRLAVSAPLSLAAILLVYLVAVPLGAWCALRAGTRREAAATTVLLGVHALPTFWVALLLILAFGPTGLDWLPVFGLSSAAKEGAGFVERALDVAAHALLPVLALASASLAWLARHVRGSVHAVLQEDFVRAARARGLSERTVLVRHALRNALLPVITLLGTVLPALVGGSVIVETIFGIEGIGKYAYDGLLRRDLSVILATTTLSAMLTLIGLLLADVGYALADPRIRLEGRRG
jgi:peptide/nickel transport system permease protein